MATINFVFLILLLLLALIDVSLSQLGGVTLRDRIESTSEELGVPIWKAWDAWWQFQSCKYKMFFANDENVNHLLTISIFPIFFSKIHGCIRRQCSKSWSNRSAVGRIESNWRMNIKHKIISVHFQIWINYRLSAHNLITACILNAIPKLCWSCHDAISFQDAIHVRFEIDHLSFRIVPNI